LPAPDASTDVLVAGADGQLGRSVVDRFSRSGLEVARRSHRELDLLDAAACRNVVERLQPVVVVDCAQMHPRLGSGTQTAEAAHNLATAARAVGALIIYVSCAEVFDGYSDQPYVESSPARPMTTLGGAKLAAERAVAGANEHHALVRTSWLFGLGGDNIVEAVLAAAAASDTVPVDAATRSCPTYTVHLAEALLSLVQRPAYGLFHIVGRGSCTKLQLARNVLREARSRARAVPLIDGLDAGATRNLVLASQRREILHLPDWQLGVRMHLKARAHATG
jgi:dTDP-4-dehydrorhamnose reductase